VQRRRRLALGTVELVALIALIALLAPGVQSEGGSWSRPVVLGACSAVVSPQIHFPSDAPRHGTGPGAILWSSAAACPDGAGPRSSTIVPSADLPAPAAIPRTPTGRALALSAPIAAAAAPHGRILLAGARVGGGGGGLGLSEGHAGGAFAAPIATGGPAAPLALTTAYLGDAALLSSGPSGGGASAIELRVHRYYASSFAAPVTVASSRSAEGLTVAMDYRSDALAVWERDGTIYARDMPGSGRSSHAVQRVASAAPDARIAALLSDDNRAILAWSETRGGITRVYAELSGTGPRFGAPRLLERFVDPHGMAPPSGSPRLVRLLSESVMLAWTGAASGHWVVRTAAVDESGVRAIETISTTGRDALLADLEPGPAGEAYALWSEPRALPSGSAPLGEQAVYAARGIDAYPGRTIFTAPELISAAGALGSTGEAAIAVDPDTDRAIAAWRTPGGAIDYSLRALGGA
jgi:hypothetical protein